MKGIAWGLIGIGLALAVSSAMQIRHVEVVRRWPTVQGTVTFVSQRPDSVDILWSPPGKSYPSGQLLVQYVYRVAGQTYRGSRLGVAPSTARILTWRRLHTWRRRDVVLVYFDPSDPSQSVVEPTVPGGTVFELVFGGLLAAVAAPGLRGRRRVLRVR